MKEICICAAIKTPEGYIIRGHRHSDCLNAMNIRGLISFGSIQGFITSRNRFVDRKEALLLQIRAGIKSVNKKDMSISGELSSEDLY